MNSALLKKSSSPDTDNAPHAVNMFGKFRGFTLKPLAQSNGPITAGANNIAYVHPVTKNNSNASDNSSNNSNPKKAPPIPKPPVVILNHSVSPKKLKPKANNVTFTATAVGKIVGNDIDIDEKPALPPLNPGQTGRPIISSPILENSTCSRRDLNSPGKTSKEAKITRPAPPKPARVVQEKLHQRAASPQVPEILVNPTFVIPEPEKPLPEIKKSKEGQILNRITSFLKKEEKVVPVIEPVEPKPKPVNSKPVLKQNRKPIDRERLKTIEISCPIPIVSDAPDTPTTPDGINRTQSMRDSNTLGRRPNNYGASMRQAGKRPQSIVGRPNLPPPPRPPSPVKTPTSPPPVPPVTYENPPPPKKVMIKDIANRSPMKSPPDMAPLAHISEESSPMTPTDNIYDEIAESPSPPHLHSTSTESMGLLGEIVSEMENRNNSDALYIASTLRKSKPGKKADNVYMNTAEVVSESEGEEEEYTSPKSIASTTSSGYMRPTGFATPVARVAPHKVASPPFAPMSSHSSVSSFKSPPSSVTSPSSTIPATNNGDISNITFTSPLSPDSGKGSNAMPSKPESLRTYKPYHTTINRPGPYLASIQAKANATTTETNNHDPKKPVTVRTRTPSPSKSSSKPLTNGIKSPDLIPKSKQPDVISKSSNAKPKPATTKPTIASTKPATTNPKGIASKYESKTTKGATTGKLGGKTAPAPPAGKASHVASLSQKFESGPKK